MRTLRRAVVVAVVAVAAIAPSASAQIFNFDNLEYNGVINTGFLPSNGISCTGGDLCSSNVDGNVFGGHLDYTSGLFMVAVRGYYRASGSDPYSLVSAMQDHENGYTPGTIGAGLGVYHESGNTSDDNVTLGEMLTLTFTTAVRLDYVGLRADGHNVTGWGNNTTYQYSTDGVNWTDAMLPKNVGKTDFSPDLVSQTFYFRYGGNNPDQFYVSTAAVSATPEPRSLVLTALGLGGLGIIARRRRPATRP